MWVSFHINWCYLNGARFNLRFLMQLARIDLNDRRYIDDAETVGLGGTKSSAFEGLVNNLMNHRRWPCTWSKAVSDIGQPDLWILDAGRPVACNVILSATKLVTHMPFTANKITWIRFRRLQIGSFWISGETWRLRWQKKGFIFTRVRPVFFNILTRILKMFFSVYS